MCFDCWSSLIAIYVLQSRSRQEDPEQLRLKQKAKEVRWHTWDVYLVRGPLCLIMGQSWYIYICVHVATDAAAGIGSDSTERSQLDGVGSYWTQKEKKTGFSFTWDWHRGTKHLSLTMAVCCPSPHLLLSLFVPSLNHLAAVGQVWDVRLCFKGLRLSQMSERTV